MKELIDRLKQIAPVTLPPSYSGVSKEDMILKHGENYSESDSDDDNPYPWQFDDYCLVHQQEPDEYLKKNDLGFNGTTWTEISFTVSSIRQY